MKKNISIQLKAAFLMIVFAMNTVIGFACSVGMDLGFNTHHHQEKGAIGFKGSHHHDKLHSHDKSHHHPDEGDNDHHKSKDSKDNCCNDKVMQFAQLDKAISQSLNAAVNPVFFTSLISSFYNIDILYTSQVTASIKYFVRSYHPP